MRRWAIDAVRPGPGLPRLPPRTHPQRQPRLPRARLQQGRGRAAHAAAAGRRRGLLPRDPPVLRRVAVPQGRHRGFPRGDGSRKPAGSLERFFERWIYGVDAAAPDASRYRVEAGADGQAAASCASNRRARSSTCRSPSRSSTPIDASRTSSCRSPIGRCETRVAARRHAAIGRHQPGRRSAGRKSTPDTRTARRQPSARRRGSGVLPSLAAR